MGKRLYWLQLSILISLAFPSWFSKESIRKKEDVFTALKVEMLKFEKAQKHYLNAVMKTENSSVFIIEYKAFAKKIEPICKKVEKLREKYLFENSERAEELIRIISLFKEKKSGFKEYNEIAELKILRFMKDPEIRNMIRAH